MTALPIPRTENAGGAPPAIDDTRWVALNEAAECLGRDPAHLRRLAREQLVRQGMALKLRSAQGVDQWWIARDFNRALAYRDDPQRHRTPSLDQYPEHQVRKAWDRVAIIRAYRAEKAATREPQRVWVPRFVRQQQAQYPKLKMSAPTIERWDRKFQCAADLVKLIDTRGNHHGDKADPAAWAYFGDVFLSQNQPSIKDCWRRTRDQARAEGWAWCSYEACRRQVDDRFPPEQQALHREPRKYRNSFEPYIQLDPDKWQPGTRWEGDHRQLDLWCWFNGKLIRPWITAWLDWKTRRVVGHVLTDLPNTSSIMASFRAGMLDPVNMGGPDGVHVDNGKDFDSYLLDGNTKKERKLRITDRVRMVESEGEGLFAQLRIGISFALPYNPRGKSRMERWYETLAAQHDKRWPTYCGAKPEERPERLAAVLKRPELVPTFEEVEQGLRNYIAQYNASADHAKTDLTMNGQPVSPDTMLTHGCPRRRELANPGVLDLFLAKWPRDCPVTRNGVSVPIKGRVLHFGEHEPAIHALMGRKSRVRVAYDPDNLDTVRVFDQDWRYLCTAPRNGMIYKEGKLTEADVGDLIAERRRVKKAAKLASRSWKHEVFPFQHQLNDRTAEGPQPPDHEPPLQVIQTKLDGAVTDVQNAERARKRGLPDITKVFDAADDRETDATFSFEAHASQAEPAVNGEPVIDPDEAEDTPLGLLMRLYQDNHPDEPEKLDLSDCVGQPRAAEGGAA